MSLMSLHALQLRQRSGYLQLVNAVHHELVDRQPLSCFWLFGRNRAANAVHTEVKRIVDRAFEIHETYARNRDIQLPEAQLPPFTAIQALRTDLSTMGYIMPVAAHDHLSFNFNEQRFRTISSYYEANARERVIDSLKFVILFTLAVLPPPQRPNDRLIVELSHLTNRIQNLAFKNSGRFLMGLFYLDRGDRLHAREWFAVIGRTSDIFQVAQSAIQLLYPQFSLNWIFDNRQQPNALRAEITGLPAEIEGIIRQFLHIRATHIRNRTPPIEDILAFKRDLTAMGYIRPAALNSHIAFNFNEDHFIAISDPYNPDTRIQLVDDLKLIILIPLASLPPNHRPTDRLIDELQPLLRRTAPSVIKDIACYAMGALYSNGRDDRVHAREYFLMVNAASPIFPAAQTAIRNLNGR